MTAITPEQYYQSKTIAYTAELNAVKQRLTTLVIARLTAFIGMALGIYFTTSLAVFIPVLIGVVGFAVFLLFVKMHAKSKGLALHLEQLVKINANELSALKGEYHMFPTGEKHHHLDHPYAYDMDLFGRGSIFQYINRTCTTGGNLLLANGLKSFQTNAETIAQKQEAIRELAEQPDWRQNFQATGELEGSNESERESLLEWIATPVSIVDALSRIALYIIPPLSIAAIVLLSIGTISFGIFLLYLTIPLGLVGRRLKLINEEYGNASEHFTTIKKYAKLLKRIEDQEFKSEWLVKAKLQMKTDGRNASGKINQLSTIIGGLDNRNNAIFALLSNAIGVWDLQYMYRLQQWKNQNQDNIQHWFEAIYEFDASASLAGFAFNHPAFCFPEVGRDQKVLEATGLGHPLLDDAERVNNDFIITKPSDFVIITGANMAGKSTFLRTVGVNLVLAMTGAPVCAKQFSCRPMQLFTSMRTTDSLQKNESYFYTELKRLKFIVEALKEGNELFIILDEILKGTNSKDKESGSKAFVEQLIQLKATGIIATHDLALCKIENDFPDHISNKRFEVEMTADDISFDYKLQSGVCQNMNATYLMKKMGITA
jgi:hypothetical protein